MHVFAEKLKSARAVPPALRSAPARPVGIQTKLAINEPGDQYEREADQVADRVMRMAAPSSISPASMAIQRKCSACEEEDKPHKLERKESGSTAAGSFAPPLVHDVLGEPGAPLDPGARAFFEPRFGVDFSHVRVHTDGRAAASARAVQATAYTSGRHIVFDSGRYQPRNTQDSLLAHELTHVIQQGSGTQQLHRKLAVQKPADHIPDPSGTGLKQTNADTIRNYLGTICAGGAVKVDGTTGVVQVSSSFCNPTADPPGFVGPPAPSAKNTGTETGCGCICDIVNSSNQWNIKVDDASWPHTDFDDDDAALGKKPGGSGGTVTAPSPNSPKLWGAGTVSGKETNIDPWLVLGHELCGHAWMANTGSHAADVASARGEGGHQETVKRENLLRAEHGIEARGSFKDPNCGESFFRDKANPSKVNWSSYWSACKAWRDAFNKAHGTSFTMNDKIP